MYLSICLVSYICNFDFCRIFEVLFIFLYLSCSLIFHLVIIWLLCSKFVLRKLYIPVLDFHNVTTLPSCWYMCDFHGLIEWRAFTVFEFCVLHVAYSFFGACWASSMSYCLWFQRRGQMDQILTCNVWQPVGKPFGGDLFSRKRLRI